MTNILKNILPIPKSTENSYQSDDGAVLAGSGNAGSKKKKFFIICSFLLILLIIVFIYLLLSKKTTSYIQNKTYTDPQNTYTISIPNDWTVTENHAQNTIGQNTSHPTTQQIEIAQFYLATKYGISVQVISGQPQCPLPTLDTTLAGFPAAYDPLANDWTIPTTKATIQVGISYPGPGRYNNPFGQSSHAVSPQTIAEDKKLLLNILKTLGFHDLQPFHC